MGNHNTTHNRSSDAGSQSHQDSLQSNRSQSFSTVFSDYDSYNQGYIRSHHCPHNDQTYLLEYFGERCNQRQETLVYKDPADFDSSTSMRTRDDSVSFIKPRSRVKPIQPRVIYSEPMPVGVPLTLTKPPEVVVFTAAMIPEERSSHSASTQTVQFDRIGKIPEETDAQNVDCNPRTRKNRGPVRCPSVNTRGSRNTSFEFCPPNGKKQKKLRFSNTLQTAGGDTYDPKICPQSSKLASREIDADYLRYLLNQNKYFRESSDLNVYSVTTTTSSDDSSSSSSDSKPVAKSADEDESSSSGGDSSEETNDSTVVPSAAASSHSSKRKSTNETGSVNLSDSIVTDKDNAARKSKMFISTGKDQSPVEEIRETPEEDATINSRRESKFEKMQRNVVGLGNEADRKFFNNLWHNAGRDDQQCCGAQPRNICGEDIFRGPGFDQTLRKYVPKERGRIKNIKL